MATLFDTFSFTGSAPGPRLLILGAVHGNETCGAVAIQRLLKELASGEVLIQAGQLTLVPVTNKLAFDRKQRAGDRNLNRNLQPNAHPQDNEDRIANELCPLLEANEVLLDLHSFHSPGQPFVMVGPGNNTDPLQPFAHASEEEALARSLGVTRAVDGWLETYARGATRRGDRVEYGVGTTEYMRARGGYGVTLECGQHEDPSAPEVAYAAIRNCLAHLRMVDAPAPPAQQMETLRLVEVVDKNQPGDRFAQPWNSFDPWSAGQLVGWRQDGAEVHSSAAGHVVFPHAAADPGTEWFYFAVRAPRFS
ncbi:succinylglutamate desuccinylase [Ramlibacter sp. G-1-2-2]|uniref:Succinylglutamate desuccinylase n=1 Tax=Ramlibacter agri TaxID=2728837 RepID=A0A848H4L8_9BURK|nr:succinylglutamate desuccinylase/aspartoacylase family protein [Ramlibacter agri]NML45504.1 succinylglutamate desuccinylase [Ramlibacter agri]